ncbi:SDR family NAD(P)-dependent oxidoreductase [Sphingobacterium siyangense]|uniref:Short-chain dehydrogenase n=1 Tax=Sphingobacterium siyangense TaxID=459529 RepID=A0A562LZK7_9SPHI|nr:SDR family NAD(P)-dependent oxidoreductase [Sphingobacterium siyangense]TWI13074.1 hypothetical protein IQ31_05512 [Sphingobacterium siyangense]
MKKILITGASGGIGLETAKRLVAKGYQLTLVARNEHKLSEIIQNFEGNGHSYIVADLANPKGVEKISSFLKEVKHDILINNAGVGLYGKFIDIPLETQLEMLYLNINAVMVLSHSFLKTAKKGDALINIGSLLGHTSFPGASAYAGSKSFVANFSESLWYEYKDQGVFISGFNPGAAKSDFHNNAGKPTNSYPEFVLSTVEQVAEELVSTLEKRSQPRVTQGWKNRMMIFGFKFLSRKMAIKIMGQLSPGMR